MQLQNTGTCRVLQQTEHIFKIQNKVATPFVAFPKPFGLYWNPIPNTKYSFPNTSNFYIALHFQLTHVNYSEFTFDLNM